MLNIFDKNIDESTIAGILISLRMHTINVPHSDHR